MGWLSKFILSAAGKKTPTVEDFLPEPYEENVGVHLLSNYGEEYEQISPDTSKETIADLITRLDWESYFYQVICTIEPGVTLEVGGSLNDFDGLSAMYRNRIKNIESVIVEPPGTRKEMIEIMQSFARGNEIWHTNYAWG